MLRTEKEIIDCWEETVENPLVSITCQTYNHEEFIAKTIEGFLMQRTTFPYEILINDDASTDGTQNIIRYYHNKYPNIIKPLLHKENHYKKGVKPTFEFNYPRAKGKYIAFCEGDDQWVSEYKLQIQAKLMEINPHISISYHPAIEVDYSKNREEGLVGKNFLNHSYDNIKNIIYYRGAYIPSQSIFMKNIDFTELKQIVDRAPIGDFFMQVYLATKGECLYIDIPMSVYRRNTEGSWTKRQKNIEEKIYYNKQMLLSLNNFRSILGEAEAKYLVHPFLHYGFDYIFVHSKFHQKLGAYKYILSLLKESNYNNRFLKMHCFIMNKFLKILIKKLKD